MFGYRCTLQTDTEVITYLFDYLVRKKGLALEESAAVVAAPFWEAIESDRDAERGRLAALSAHRVSEPAGDGAVFPSWSDSTGDSWLSTTD